MDDSTDPGLDRYVEAARRAARGGCVCEPESAFGAHHDDDTTAMPVAAINASFGCGNPTAVVELHEGDTVLDLGSGGGLDVLLSARRVAPTGRVYGIDATAEMVGLARTNAAASGITNVEFLHGRLEHVPLPDQSVDVVISNCVLVLTQDKDAVFDEIARVLRPGGRIGIGDIVRTGDAHDDSATVDCAAGAVTIDDYEDTLRRAGLS